MKRQIITIDEKRCNGCGLCVSACHEGAIQMINGKARLISESYCDGLGDCLPACPTGAITIEERDVAAYDETAVEEHLARKESESQGAACDTCPSTVPQTIKRGTPSWAQSLTPVIETVPVVQSQAPRKVSELQQWPVMIKLVPPNAPFLRNADILIAATCSAFSYANFHEEFIKDKITLVGCPKLDGVDYAEKLAQIFAANDIKSVSIVRMTVPCCGGLVQSVKRAFQMSNTMIPWSVVTIGTDGSIIK
jgi:NAD-dependent dihydropyrimidine dehydrogenase PreA subunit